MTTKSLIFPATNGEVEKLLNGADIEVMKAMLLQLKRREIVGKNYQLNFGLSFKGCSMFEI